MNSFKVLGRNSEHMVTVYNVYDFPYEKLCPKIVSSKKRKRKSYYDMLSTFDIETTTIDTREDIDGEKKVTKKKGNPYGFMYHWQMCVGGYVVFGRRWEELTGFLKSLVNFLNVSRETLLVIYVHNLSFEFQFIKDFFNWENIFATDERKVLRCVTKEGIEFRCSFKLSNMSLAMFTQKTESVEFIKREDDLDYRKIRYPWTMLDDTEKGYCYCDVMGLYEAILLKLKEDDIANIPMTSTGYVRRDCKAAIYANQKNWKLFQKMRFGKELYEMALDLMRGGNTHCNRNYAGITLHNLMSFDIRSAYPYVICTKKFPLSAWIKVDEQVSLDEFKRLSRKKCVIGYLGLFNAKVKEQCPIPYIPISKCTKCTKPINYNGRVLYADELEIAVTELDMSIILEQYDFSEYVIHDVYIAEKGLLPVEIRKEVIKWYEYKQSLKGKDAYLYARSKEFLNSINGMMCTKPVHDIITYSQVASGGWKTEHPDIETELNRFFNSRNNFVNYFWGIYVTAHARYHHNKIIKITGENTVYADTDSDKALKSDVAIAEINRINRIIEKEDEQLGAYCDYNGKRYYLGTFEREDDINVFRSFGSKKYATITNGKFEITVAGVGKKKGAQEILQIARNKHRSAISCFNWGLTLHNCGRTTSWYNDTGKRIIDTGYGSFLTASNIGVLNTTYKLGVTDEFAEITGISVDTTL